MKPGDLVMHGATVGIAIRRLQYHSDDDAALNWDGEPAWWVQFANDDDGPTWSYDEELTPVKKGN